VKEEGDERHPVSRIDMVREQKHSREREEVLGGRRGVLDQRLLCKGEVVLWHDLVDITHKGGRGTWRNVKG